MLIFLFLNRSITSCIFYFAYGTTTLLRGGSIVGFLLFLFTDEMRRYMEASAKRVINLRDMGFYSRDIDCLRRVLNSEKYETLARDYNVSLSTIKHRMKELFRSLDVCDRIEFLAHYARIKIIWKIHKYVYRENNKNSQKSLKAQLSNSKRRPTICKDLQCLKQAPPYQLTTKIRKRV